MFTRNSFQFHSFYSIWQLNESAVGSNDSCSCYVLLKCIYLALAPIRLTIGLFTKTRHLSVQGITYDFMCICRQAAIFSTSYFDSIVRVDPHKIQNLKRETQPAKEIAFEILCVVNRLCQKKKCKQQNGNNKTRIAVPISVPKIFSNRHQLVGNLFPTNWDSRRFKIYWGRKSIE